MVDTCIGPGLIALIGLVSRDMFYYKILYSSTQLAYIRLNQRQPETLSGICSVFLGVPIAFTLLLLQQKKPPRTFLESVAISLGVYFGVIIGAVIFYRISPFHPLAGYPGPLVCRISRWWAFKLVRSGNQHRYYYDLHKKFGPVVRTGMFL